MCNNKSSQLCYNRDVHDIPLKSHNLNFITTQLNTLKESVVIINKKTEFTKNDGFIISKFTVITEK